MSYPAALPATSLSNANWTKPTDRVERGIVSQLVQAPLAIRSLIAEELRQGNEGFVKGVASQLEEVLPSTFSAKPLRFQPRNVRMTSKSMSSKITPFNP